MNDEAARRLSLARARDYYDTHDTSRELESATPGEPSDDELRAMGLRRLDPGEPVEVEPCGVHDCALPAEGLIRVRVAAFEAEAGGVDVLLCAGHMDDLDALLHYAVHQMITGGRSPGEAAP